MNKKEKIKELLIALIYTPDSKPRYHNDNWLGGDVDDKLKRIDNTIDDIIEAFESTPYEDAGELLCVDEDELSLQEQVDAIVAQSKIDPQSLIDFVEGVIVWEKVEYSFSCKGFLKHIGLW
jgi:N12 class adenine-specific DNA methylase